MNWSRKHMCDLACVLKKYMDHSGITEEQRTSFSLAYKQAHQISSLPDCGGFKSITSAIRATCKACQASVYTECQSRSQWREECHLVQDGQNQLSVM
jgi:hypothetical protein